MLTRGLVPLDGSIGLVVIGDDFEGQRFLLTLAEVERRRGPAHLFEEFRIGRLPVFEIVEGHTQISTRGQPLHFEAPLLVGPLRPDISPVLCPSRWIVGEQEDEVVHGGQAPLRGDGAGDDSRAIREHELDVVNGFTGLELDAGVGHVYAILQNGLDRPFLCHVAPRRSVPVSCAGALRTSSRR